MAKFNELAYNRRVLSGAIKDESLEDMLVRAQRIIMDRKLSCNIDGLDNMEYAAKNSEQTLIEEN